MNSLDISFFMYEIEILLMLYAIHNHADSVQGEGNSLDISFLMYEIEILLADQCYS